MPYQERKCTVGYATVLIDLLWFNVVHYSSLFQYFFSIYYGPYTLVENSYYEQYQNTPTYYLISYTNWHTVGCTYILPHCMVLQFPGEIIPHYLNYMHENCTLICMKIMHGCMHMICIHMHLYISITDTYQLFLVCVAFWMMPINMRYVRTCSQLYTNIHNLQ